MKILLMILTEATESGLINDIVEFITKPFAIIGVSATAVGSIAIAVLRTILPNNRVVLKLLNKVNDLQHKLSNKEKQLKEAIEQFSVFEDKITNVVVELTGVSPSAKIRELGEQLDSFKTDYQKILNKSVDVVDTVADTVGIVKRIQRK